MAICVALPCLLACGTAFAAATLAQRVADCDAPTHAQVVEPSVTSEAVARAYWLDRHWLQWPGAPEDGTYRLYHSAQGRLEAAPGQPVRGADGALALAATRAEPPAPLTTRFAFVAPGARLAVAAADTPKLSDLLRQQTLLVREDAQGQVLEATGIQHPGLLDDLYAAAANSPALGASAGKSGTTLRLWAPTARAASVCLHGDGAELATARLDMLRDEATGVWTATSPRDLRGRHYTYLIDVFVPGTGMVRNRVTDPYSTSLDVDSARSYLADLDDPALEPPGWDGAPRPAPLAAATDMVVYELHVRDFSRDDKGVETRNRGKYLAFADPGSAGMRHLRTLAAAGLTDVHLLPVFDLASVPEAGCVEPAIPDAGPASPAQQAAVAAVAARDCFNWGYDPWHFNAPEGSFASDAADGAVRVREFRAMVMALHGAGLRVGMDVVYNHTTASGQDPRSVLDRIVPGYYHRLDADGRVERSTCCDNTATEHAMMARLMIDSAESWVRHYRIDSFRFDLMGHQPRAAMETLQARVDAAAGRHVELIGEGWNFGEVADGARFVQASQGSLAGSGIGSFSDRARDAIRGGGPADRGRDLLAPGYVNGLAVASQRRGSPARDELLHAADLVRVGLAGTLRDYQVTNRTGERVPLSAIDYKGAPAGYASEPGEVVNYVENHDNQTLFDINVLKLPATTSREDRARVQVLALALNAFSQGIAYFHAGGELLRSKSLDRNSFDSGDWFNRLDWHARDNAFGSGLPPQADNGEDWALLRPLLANAAIRPHPAEMAWTRDAFVDLLRIRASTTLLRLRTADDVRRRLEFPNTGPAQNPLVMAGRVDGEGYAGARFRELLYLVNVSPRAQVLELPAAVGKAYVLHPVHLAPGAADARPRTQARFDGARGRFRVPARTAVVYVVEP